MAMAPGRLSHFQSPVMASAWRMGAVGVGNTRVDAATGNGVVVFGGASCSCGDCSPVMDELAVMWVSSTIEGHSWQLSCCGRVGHAALQ